MTILRIKIAVLLLLCSLAGARAQVRPDQFPLQTNIEGTNFEIYSQYNGVNTKTLPIYMKEYFVPNVDSAWQAFTFTDSIGIADSLRMMFLKDNRGRVFYVDADGDALLLKDTAQAVGNVYALATLADTSTVASPVEGDIAVVGSDTLLFYETYWLMFAGGAGGIYGGSGTVPASTWVEQLGSLIFDIDSLGSFTVGDIDEKNTGARISVSNSGGNDGQVTIKSGSGAGFTSATVEVNNYQLPGTTPSEETLADGDYLWIVSQAGVRKGQDSTGWIHIDSLLNGYVQGSGTDNTVPLWSSGSLGNSAITQSGQEIAMGVTGALTVPSGTDAQVPVWGAGKLRYNTTQGGFQGGANGYYLPFSSSPDGTNSAIPYWSSGRLITDASNFYYSSDILYVGNASYLRIHPAVTPSNMSVQIGSTSTLAGGSVDIMGNTSGTQSSVAIKGTTTGNEAVCISCNSANYATVAIGRNSRALNRSIAIGFNSRANNNNSLSIGENAYGDESGAIVFGTGANTGGQYTNMYLGTGRIRGEGGSATYSTGAGGNFTINGSGAYGTNQTGGNLTIAGGKGTGSGTPGYISFSISTLGASGSTLQSLTEKARIQRDSFFLYGYGAGNITGTPTYSAAYDTNGKLIEVPEKWGTISTSTDVSGDIVVAHGMGTTPTSVQVTVTGTTPYVVTVHTIDATNFTVRFYDMTGAAVTTTAVTATWHSKT